MQAYKKMVWGSLIVVVLLILPLIIYFFFIQPGKTAETPRLPPDEHSRGVEDIQPVSPHQEPVTGPGFKLDFGLNNSDVGVRKLLGDCSTVPGFAIWLKEGDLVRRVVAVTSNIANGSSPSSLLPFLAPAGKFEVSHQGGKVFIDPGSYKRYRQFTGILESIDSEKLVQIYYLLQPLFEEAYRELGYPGESFHQVLKRAIKVLLSTPVVEGEIQVVENITSYTFTDPVLENLNEAQKHLLRMGPVNTRIIKGKLGQIFSLLKEP